jgi:predicted PhzF superfamily epimerase YddE/YHI9
MGIMITHVDAFTDRPFSGNPAAVCILSASADERWMQNVASEMNLSETAFLHPETDGYRLRWFTPGVEVDLCGHATIAAAHVLWESDYLEPGRQARFQTRSGLLMADRRGNWIELDFPATPPVAAKPATGLLDALAVRPSFVGKSRFDYLLEVESEEVLRNIKPNFQQLLGAGVRGIIVTARSSSAPYDFVSRFFAPAAGVNEDPVTGSAHCALGPYWKNRLGKDDFLAYQASSRGGVVKVAVRGSRVVLAGQARTVLRGELV